MVRLSYIIILSDMGDDVPILGALVMLSGAMGVLFFMSLYISMARSSYIISVFGMGDDLPILGNGFTVVFDEISIHQYVQIII